MQIVSNFLNRGFWKTNIQITATKPNDQKPETSTKGTCFTISVNPQGIFIMGNEPGSRILIKPKPFEAFAKKNCNLQILKNPGKIPRQNHELFGASLKI